MFPSFKGDIAFMYLINPGTVAHKLIEIYGDIAFMCLINHHTLREEN